MLKRKKEKRKIEIERILCCRVECFAGEVSEPLGWVLVLVLVLVNLWRNVNVNHTFIIFPKLDFIPFSFLGSMLLFLFFSLL